MSEALQTQLIAHIGESDRRHDATDASIKLLFEAVGERVEKSTFFWVIGALITILCLVVGGMFGILWSQNNSLATAIAQKTADISADISSLQNDVSQIKGKLEPYNIEFKK